MKGDAFIRKYVMKKAEDGDYLHSSGFGRAQAGDSIGAAGIARERRPDEGERKFVEGYNRSGVMEGMKSPISGAKPYTPPAPGAGGGLGGSRPNTAMPPRSAPLPPRRGI